MTPLGERFEEAVIWATRLHREQERKGAGVPYVSHLLSVCALVLEDGGDEDQAIAALLHDAVEDQGGLPTLEEIRRRFGPRVAMIVEGCTDAVSVPKPPWRARKERYLEHLASAPPEVLRVSTADKLHNARSILADYRLVGEDLWSRFTAGPDQILWYYRSLLAAFQQRGNSLLVQELARVVWQLGMMIEARPAVR